MASVSPDAPLRPHLVQNSNSLGREVVFGLKQHIDRFEQLLKLGERGGIKRRGRRPGKLECHEVVVEASTTRRSSGSQTL